MLLGAIVAGQYTPEAAQALSDIEVPSFVAVIGKPSSFKRQDGTISVTVRLASASPSPWAIIMRTSFCRPAPYPFASVTA